MPEQHGRDYTNGIFYYIHIYEFSHKFVKMLLRDVLP